MGQTFRVRDNETKELITSETIYLTNRGVVIADGVVLSNVTVELGTGKILGGQEVFVNDVLKVSKNEVERSLRSISMDFDHLYAHVLWTDPCGRGFGFVVNVFYHKDGAFITEGEWHGHKEGWSAERIQESKERYPEAEYSFADGNYISYLVSKPSCKRVEDCFLYPMFPDK